MVWWAWCREKVLRIHCTLINKFFIWILTPPFASCFHCCCIAVVVVVRVIVLIDVVLLNVVIVLVDVVVLVLVLVLVLVGVVLVDVVIVVRRLIQVTMAVTRELLFIFSSWKSGLKPNTTKSLVFQMVKRIFLHLKVFFSISFRFLSSLGLLYLFFI